MLDYANISSSIGLLISAKMATLHELQTVYGMSDVMDMIEVLMVDNKNKQIMEKSHGNHN